MKPLTIHVGSAAIGAGLALVLFLSAGAAAIGGSSLLTFRQTPTPAAFFRVVEGVPFTVPQGRALVITQLGWRHVSGSPNNIAHLRLLIDGDNVWSVWVLEGADGRITPGLVVPPGAVLSVSAGAGGTAEGVALGYFDTLTPAPAP
jgi:hypothetical protein